MELDSENTEFKIWNLADEIRSNGNPINLMSFLNLARSKNIDLDINTIISLNERLGLRSEIRTSSRFITDFIASCMENSGIGSILDPWAGIGALLHPIVEKINPNFAMGIVKTRNELEIANFISKDVKIEWILENTSKFLDTINHNFDIIVGFPPWNLKKESISMNSSEGKVSIHDQIGKLEMLKSLMLLKDGGTAFFILDYGFMFNKNIKNVFSNLEKFGLYLDSAFEIPSGNFSFTSLGGILVVIKRKNHSNLFIGELNPSSNDYLLENLNKRQGVKNPRFGHITKIETLDSFKKIFGMYELRKKLINSGLSSIPFTEIYEDLKYYSSNGFEDKPNCVYLPRIGNSPVVNEIEKFQIKPQNYIQIILKEDKIDSEFLAHFYNTDLGIKLRELLKSSTVVPRINKRNLINSEIFLPNLNIQKEVLKIDTSIRDILTQLKIEHNNLWKYPEKVKEISNVITKINIGYNTADWINSLPFPLASILWAYDSEIDYTTKFKCLLRFFEAFSQFNLAFILGAIKQNETFYFENFSECSKKVRKKWYKNPDFGNWTILGREYSQIIQNILNSEDSSTETCLRLFGNPNIEFLKIVTSNEFYDILDKARRYRNRWDAHDTPTLSNEEFERRIRVVFNLVLDLKNLILNLYDTISYFSPIQGICKGSECFYDVKLLKGPNSHFKNDKVKVSPSYGILDSCETYFINENQIEPIKVFPLFKIIKKSKTPNICYFYNSIEEDNVRLVSYHDKDSFHEFFTLEEFDIGLLSDL